MSKDRKSAKEEDWIEKIQDIIIQIAPSEEMFLWAVNWIKKDIKSLIAKENRKVIKKIEKELIKQNGKLEIAMAESLILRNWDKLKKEILNKI